MKTSAKIFIWIGMILGCILIFPVVIGVIALNKLNKSTNLQEIHNFGIITLLLCSFLGGVFMISLKEEDINPFKNKKISSKKEPAQTNYQSIVQNKSDVNTDKIANKKNIGLKIAGIIFIVIQCLGTIMGSVYGDINPFNEGVLYTIGYFAIGIIGLIFICIYLYQNSESTNSSQSIQNETQNIRQEFTNTNENQLQNKQTTDNSNIHSDNCLLPNKVAEKYTRMFKRPFDNIHSKEIFFLNNYKCVLYKFNQPTKDNNIGTFCYLIKVNADVTRFFASEYSLNDTYDLYEWKFEYGKETLHINLGKVVSSKSDMFSHQMNIKQKLKEILT